MALPEAPGPRSPLKIATLTAAASALLLIGLWLVRGRPVDDSVVSRDHALANSGGAAVRKDPAPSDATRRPAPLPLPSEPVAPLPELPVSPPAQAPLRPPATTTPEERRRVMGVIAGYQERVASQLAIDGVRRRPMTGTLAIRLRRVVWLEESGAEFARIGEATGRLDLPALQRGDLVISNVVLEQPEVHLREADADWNYAMVLAGLIGDHGSNGDNDTNGARTSVLNGVTITHGVVDVETRDDSYRLQDLNAALDRVTFTSPTVPDPELVVTSASAILNLRDEEPIAIDAADGRARITEEGVLFDFDRAAIGRVLLADVNGVWDSTIPVWGVEGEGRTVGVQLADVQGLLPEGAPAEGIATFTWMISTASETAVDVAVSDLRLESEGSEVTGLFTVRLAPPLPIHLLSADLVLDPLSVTQLESFTGPLPYDGTLRGTVRGTADDLAFDLTADLTADDVPGAFRLRLAGSAAITPDGLALGRVTADLVDVPLLALRRYVPRLPLQGTVNGRVVLIGAPTRAPLAVDVRLDLAAGSATLAGTIDMTGAVPSYDLTGELIGINLQQLLEPSAPPVRLTADYALVGRGTTAAEADATVRIQGGFSGWQTAPGDAVVLRVRVQAGAVDVDSLSLRLATLDAKASGVWRFLEPRSGSIRYAVSVTSLSPWGPYLPLVGDSLAVGAIAAAGTMTGALAAPRLEGEVSGEQLSASGWAASGVRVEYAISLGGNVPEGRVALSARGVKTPTAGEYTEVTATVTLTRADFRLALDANRVDGGRVEATATGHVPATGARALTLERAELDLVDRRWSLVSPATFRWGSGAGTDVDNFEMRESATGGLVRVDGRVLPLSSSDFVVETAAFPVDEFQSLIGIQPVVSGDLWTTTRVRGAGPSVDVQFRLEGGAIDDAVFLRLEGTATYASGQIRTNAVAAIDTAGALELQLDLPAMLSFEGQPSFALVERGGISGSLVARGVSITPLESLSPQLRELTGQVDGLVGITGTVEQPNMDGRFALSNGSVRVPALRQTYDQMTAQLTLEGRDIVVSAFQLRSDGTLTVTGRIALESLTRPVADLTVHLERFRAVGVPGYEDAAFYGVIFLSGPADALEATGNARIADGYLPIPEFGSRASDLLGDLPAFELEEDKPATGTTNALFEGLVIRDLRVEVGSDVWFTTEAASAQLGGELTINKAGDALAIEGTLRGERGTYTLEAGPIVRRFDIVSAEVRFLGDAQMNPAIDITARRLVFDPPDREMEVNARVTGTVRSPKLTLSSPDAPNFPPEEMLSLLVFGKSSLELGGGGLSGDEVLEMTFLGSFAELATLELEETLARDLGVGFDIFGVRFASTGGVGGFGVPVFVFGWEVGKDVFLTAESALAGLFTSTANPASPWALRLEWAFAPSSRLSASFEPVTPTRYVHGVGLRLPFTPKQQFSLEVRRRWTY